MGDDKPPAYAGYPPPQYMPPPPQQNLAPQTAGTGNAGTGAKSFFPIYDSNRFFRV